MLGLRDEVVAYVVDEALAVRVSDFEREARNAATGGSSFSRLDAVLRGHGPRISPDGLRYQDPRALFREEMERRAAEGLVN